jgi:nucleoside-diphosphate-sugar epimerase
LKNRYLELASAKQGINMHFLVTGTGGYVGKHVVDALIKQGHQVTAVSRQSTKTTEITRSVSYDVLASTADVFERLGKPDVCIHAAWENGFNHGHESHIRNVEGHISFMRNMLEGGLKHLVGIGTAHEIGFHVGAISEFTPTNPQNPYGIAKNYLQRVQRLLCEKHGATEQWLRCYYITGDDARNNSIFRKLLEATNKGQKAFPLNSGELLYDFIDVAELGRLIALVSSQSKVTGIINCCSGEPVTLKTMVQKFIIENSLDIEPKWGEFPNRSYDSKAVWGDTEKLKRALQSSSSA